MNHPNLDILNRFFEAYGNRDMTAIREVMYEDAQWIFPGRNPYSGTKEGIEEIVAFFDQMSPVGFEAEILFINADGDYVLESQRVQAMAVDGSQQELDWCVQWKFLEGRILEGKHFSADQYKADEFFNHVKEQNDKL